MACIWTFVQYPARWCGHQAASAAASPPFYMTVLPTTAKAGGLCTNSSAMQTGYQSGRAGGQQGSRPVMDPADGLSRDRGGGRPSLRCSPPHAPLRSTPTPPHTTWGVHLKGSGTAILGLTCPLGITDICQLFYWRRSE